MVSGMSAPRFKAHCDWQADEMPTCTPLKASPLFRCRAGTGAVYGSLFEQGMADDASGGEGGPNQLRRGGGDVGRYADR
jgi:hypothetical protein